MKKLTLLFAIITITGFSVFGQTPRITDIQWKLTFAGGQRVENSAAYFEIDPNSGKFTGNTGCNRMFGKAVVKQNKLTFSDVASTKKMCKLPEGSVPESVLLKGLDDTFGFAVSGNELQLYNRDGHTILKFKRLVRLPPARPATADPKKLEGHTWKLESVGNRETFAALEGYMKFDKKAGRISGNDGCNSFGGKYTASGGRLKISKLLSTLMACEEFTHGDRQFSKELSRANRYKIEDGRLRLYRSRTLLLTLRNDATN